MRLALFIEHFHPAAGGAEGVAVGVVRGLLRRGHEIQVIAADGEAVDGCGLRTVPRNRQAEVALDLAAAGWLTVDWGLTVPARVHRLGGGLTRPFRRYNRQAKPELLRGLAWVLDTFSPKRLLEYRLERELILQPDTKLLAVSQLVADHVAEVAPAAAPRVTMLHNGVDIKRFTPAGREPVRAEMRRELGLADDAVVFLMLAHNPRLKNVELALRLFHTLARKHPGARLVVAGRHPSGAGLPWLVEPGHVAAPERLYAAADVLLHPTYYDACANVVLEGLASGLPVVSSDRNGSAEIITSGHDGFVLPVAGEAADDVRAQWAEVVLWLAEDAPLRERIGHAARTLAEAHSFDAYLDRFEAFLRQA